MGGGGPDRGSIPVSLAEWLAVSRMPDVFISNGRFARHFFRFISFSHRVYSSTTYVESLSSSFCKALLHGWNVDGTGCGGREAFV